MTRIEALQGATARAGEGGLVEPVWPGADWAPQTDRERRLAEQLAYRETLIREMHHRVKNSLALLVALARAEARRLDPDARVAIQDLASRLIAIGAVHDQLYRSDDHAVVCARSFLEQICSTLEPSGTRRRVHVGAGLRLTPAQAGPVGMIVAEAVTNSLRHAYPEGEPGGIEVRLSTLEGSLVLQIEDWGRGFAPGETMRCSGFSLMAVLARQLRGTLRVDARPGNGVLLEVCFAPTA